MKKNSTIHSKASRVEDMDATATTDSEAECVHFEEFKLFLESAERVTDRRLELNRTNASISLLIIAGLGTSLAWVYDKKDLFPIAVLAIAMISLLAAMFCRWWWQQIESYKELNGAKFQILNDMARRTVFSIDEKNTVPSYEPFAKEWQTLEERMALQKFQSRLALGASWSELTIPKSFLFLYCIIFTSAIVVFVLNRFDIVLLKMAGITS